VPATRHCGGAFFVVKDKIAAGWPGLDRREAPDEGRSMWNTLPTRDERPRSMFRGFAPDVAPTPATLPIPQHYLFSQVV